jgi:hypothetical protein
MYSYRATVTLICSHLQRATAELRAALTDQVREDGPAEIPDWTTLVVTGPTEVFDRRGNVCFEYSATVRRVESRRLVRA